MTKKMWFGPLAPPAVTWDVPTPADDSHFVQLLTTMACLLDARYQALEIGCQDASRLTASALNALLNPLLAQASSRLRCLRIWQYQSLGASTIALLARQTPNLRTLEILDGPRLDVKSISALALLPHLEELAIDDVAFSPECPRDELLRQLAACKSLRRLAVPGCFLSRHEIALVIDGCKLTKLAVASQFDEDGQRSIQADHPDCDIDWGYLT